MRVDWVGSFDPQFSRNVRIADWIRRWSSSVEIVHVSLWNIDRTNPAPLSLLKVALSAAIQYPILVFRLMVRRAPDAYLVSYPGWLDMPFVALVARFKRAPVFFDPFISLHDTIVEDRGLYAKNSAVGRLTRALDRVSMRLADELLADTEPHLRYFRQLGGLDPHWGEVLPVGADDDVFARYRGAVDENLVAFYGSLIPLQGIETILKAAEILGSSGVRTMVVGDGQEKYKIEEAFASGAAEYLEWKPPVPLDALPGVVGPAAVCLGIFGTSKKADRVVPHKVYECLAMGKPVITRDSAAIRSMFAQGEILTVGPGDPRALARVIKNLLADPERREKLSEAGHDAYLKRFHGSLLSNQFRTILERRLRAPHEDEGADPGSGWDSGSQGHP